MIHKRARFEKERQIVIILIADVFILIRTPRRWISMVIPRRRCLRAGSAIFSITPISLGKKHSTQLWVENGNSEKKSLALYMETRTHLRPPPTKAGGIFRIHFN